MSQNDSERFLELKERVEAIATLYSIEIIAFKQGWLKEGDGFWSKMIDDRNMTSHAYDEKVAKEIYSRLADYARAYDTLTKTLSSL